ncbi:MAG: arylsulfotransferase family protein [Candidatus Eiseniibacteriota bacterium]
MSRGIGGRLVLAAALLAALPASFFAGFLVHEKRSPPFALMSSLTEKLGLADRAPGRGEDAAEPGHWARAEQAGGEQLASLQQEEVERLRALGYLSADEEAPETTGVTVYDREKAGAEMLLYTSGHAPMAILMDRTGVVRHAWRRSFEEAFPGVPAPADQPSFHYFRKVHLYETGDLLVIFEGKALLKLDQDSNILWAHRNGAHHDFQVMPGGEIWVLTREAHVIPEVHATRPVLEDFVSLLDANGEELQRHSLLEAVRASHYAPFLGSAPEAGDLLHTNTLEILDGSLAARSPAFGAGNALVSFNRISVVGVVDMAQNKLVWALSGFSHRNHDPTFLPNGNLLLFDNSGSTGGRSRVLEIDPLTQQVVWAYSGDESNDFYSECCGTNHRLANGNTLITETEAGRAFEVTPANEIVWEFFNPHRAGENDELIAFLLEMRPLPAGQPLAWLAGAG